MDMQKLIDELSKGWRAQRSLSQMTLGRFIGELEKYSPDKQIENICSPHSYRGYYSDLAFEKGDDNRTVGSLLQQLKEGCLNREFTGYKGGEFNMDENTPLWLANYGECGMKITGIIEGDVLSLSLTDDV